MLRTDLADHRSSEETSLLRALRARDPLALAEAYHRTIAAGHACARRLLSSPREVESLLRAVYSGLWQDPPEDESLEGWVRRRCFALGSEHLRERGSAPVAPSVGIALPDLPEPSARRLDAAERAVAALPPEQRRALVLTHDQGVPSDEQGDPDATASLEAALLALAGPGSGNDPAGPADACDDVPLLADWVLGVLDADEAARVADAVARRPACGEVAKALRRGRRRLETLPPTPDMGQRILVTVLAEGGGGASLSSALDDAAPGDRAAAVATPAPAPQPSPAPPPSPAPRPASPSADEPASSLDEPPAAEPTREPVASAGEDTEQWRLSDLIEDEQDDDLSAVFGDRGESAPAFASPGSGGATRVDETPAADEDLHDTGPEPADAMQFPGAGPSPGTSRRQPGPSSAGRVLRWLGFAVILVLGAVIGVWIGFFIVNQL